MNVQTISRFSIAVLTTCFLAAPQAYANESQTLNVGWLLETAKTVILTNSPWSDVGCSVEIDHIPDDISLYRSGQIEVEGILERIPNNLRDIGAVNVEVYIDGELYMVFDPVPYITVTVNTFVSANDIERDQVITENDVDEIAVNVRTLPSSDTYGSLDEIIGLAARMNIQVGRILTDGMLELPTLVQRGDSLIVCIPLGAAHIILNGIALDSGSLGENIRVRNPDTNVIITAEVTGPSRATIHLLN